MTHSHKTHRCQSHCADACVQARLGTCEICGCAVSHMLSSCPGFTLNSDAKQALLDGRVTDLAVWRVGQAILKYI